MKKRRVLKKTMFVFGAAAIALIMVSSATATGINTQNVEQIPKVASEPQNQDINDLLSKFGLNTESTIKEFKRILHKSVLKNPLGSTKLLRDLNTLSNTLEQIGVTDDMTIAEAITVIKNNPEPLQERNINMFCTISVFGMGVTIPINRDLVPIALRGGWEIYYTNDPRTHAEIIGSSGRQYTENVCGGRFYFFNGRISCLGVMPPRAQVNGEALVCISDVPFV